MSAETTTPEPTDKPKGKGGLVIALAMIAGLMVLVFLNMR
jgi:hypothetical protein